MPDVLMIPRGIGCYPVGAKVYDYEGEPVEVVGAYGLQHVVRDGASFFRVGYVCRTQDGKRLFYRAVDLTDSDGRGYLRRVK